MVGDFAFHQGEESPIRFAQQTPANASKQKSDADNGKLWTYPPAFAQIAKKVGQKFFEKRLGEKVWRVPRCPNGVCYF